MIHYVISDEERARRERESLKEMAVDAFFIAPVIFAAIFVMLNLDTIVYGAELFFGL